MTASEDVERAMKGVEDAGSFGTGVASGLRLTCQTIRADPVYQAAREAFQSHPAIAVPVVLDRAVRYSRVDPGQYEHPNDTTMLAFMLLAEDALGAESPELRIIMLAAEMLPNQWWTRQFIERMRVASQSRG